MKVTIFVLSYVDIDSLGEGPVLWLATSRQGLCDQLAELETPDPELADYVLNGKPEAVYLVGDGATYAVDEMEIEVGR